MNVARFLAESKPDHSMLLDRALGDLVTIPLPLLEAAECIVALVRSRDLTTTFYVDTDEYVEVLSHGTGLGLAGLLSCHGINVICSHTWASSEVLRPV